MQHREIEIINKLGLHARASAKLTQLAAKFESDVQVTRNGRKVNAKSIMGVMMLAAGKGSKITLEIDGSDEDAGDGRDLRSWSAITSAKDNSRRLMQTCSTTDSTEPMRDALAP